MGQETLPWSWFAALLVMAAIPLAAALPGPAPTPSLCEIVNVPLGCPVWSAEFDGPTQGEDGATDVAVSPDGAHVYVAGYSFYRPPSSTGYDYTVLAYDAAQGSEQWVSRYNGPGDGSGASAEHDFAMALDVAPDGQAVYVTGYSAGYVPDAGSWATGGVATLALDASTGAQLWRQRYHGTALSSDTGRDVVANPTQASVHVLATVNNVGGQDAYVATYDAQTGSLVWEYTYNGPGGAHDSAYFRSLATSPDGTLVYFVAQSYAGPATGYDYAVLALDAQTGTVSWQALWDGGEGNVDRPFSLAFDASQGQVVATGRSRTTATDYDYATIALDGGDGSLLWAQRYDAGLRDEGYSVDAAGGMVFVSGTSDADAAGWEAATVAYEASSGALMWQTRTQGVPGGVTSAVDLVALDDASQVVVAGSLSAADGSDYWVTGFHALTGTELWRFTQSGTGAGQDGARAIAAAPGQARVYPAGDWYAGQFTTWNIATFAVDASADRPLPPLPVG